MEQLNIGIIGTSHKENERRLPIHPAHLGRLDESLRSRVLLESGYGESFGLSDTELTPHVGGVLPREQLVAECAVIMLPKPLPGDVAGLRDGQVLWGWPHCVQDREITQLAIDKRLTLIAFEAMNHWSGNGSFAVHVLNKNNELAGYASVLHALGLSGLTGSYGRPLRAVVIGSGATARGAVTALTALGIVAPEALTTRDPAAVAASLPGGRVTQFAAGEQGHVVLTEDGEEPMPSFLAGHDVIVNCVLQDPNRPIVFLTDTDLPVLAPGTLIIDVSCDDGMGFSWARSTTFDEPMFVVGQHVNYYGVDHSPSYLWDSATWEVSEALLPYLRTVLDGPTAWAADETIRHAIEIQDGVIQNSAILEFQSRAPHYPHEVRR